MKQPCHICLLPVRLLPVPAMGCYRPALYDVGTYGFYWSSPPNVGYADTAYKQHVNGGVVNVINDNDRYNGYVAGDRPDGSPWFK
ncbi:MAG: hypothetical protein J6I60_03110 [Bacteroidaceae bacterium]|nr:hypothetical protein [Bacteroidaceae bacterium]